MSVPQRRFGNRRLCLSRRVVPGTVCRLDSSRESNGMDAPTHNGIRRAKVGALIWPDACQAPTGQFHGFSCSKIWFLSRICG